MKTLALASALSLSLLGSACTDDTYVIGALCTAIKTCPGQAGSDGGGAGGGGTAAAGGLGGEAGQQPDGFVLDFTGSGVERLPQQLFGQDPTDFLIADDATPQSWKARVGSNFDVVAPDMIAVGEASPFADPGHVLSHAAPSPFASPSGWGDTRAGALALEAVFRGEPGATLLLQQDAGFSFELTLDVGGRLSLRLAAQGVEVLASSQPLVSDAWHHCLVLLDNGQSVAQILCNGQAGVAANVPAGFALGPFSTSALIGGAGAARLHFAELGRWQAPSWAPRSAWPELARERFARLVGTYVDGAPDPLPFADVRASGAYVDMTPSDAPELRRLHPVGEHWPRIVCRPTGDAPRTCGLLVEAASSQPVAPENFTLDHWTTSGVAVTPRDAVGPTGKETLAGVTPSGSATTHAVELAVPLGDGPAVLSFFARAGSARLVQAEVVGLASTTFDLEQPAVMATTGTLLAGAEAWGDGLIRLSYSFDVKAGPGRLRLTLLADDAAAVFAGDGSVAAELGDVELRFRSFATPLPTFGAIQQADHLVYSAKSGNLPAAGGLTFGAEIWLPAAPLVADAAVVNINFGARYDQQINLFVSPQDGSLQFWGLQGQATPWQFSNPQRVTDGNVHEVVANVTATRATLSVDGKSTSAPAKPYDLSLLDRVEIGTSTSSSGPLTGMVRRIHIAALP